MTDFDFDTWVVNGTVLTKDVRLNNHHDAAYFERVKALQEELAKAEKHEDDDSLDAVGGDVDDILARMEALDAEYAEYDIVVTVRALEPAVVRKISVAHMPPAKPRAIPDDAPQSAQDKRQRELAVWLEECDDMFSERDLHFISASVVTVVSAQGTADSISVDSLRAMKVRPRGPLMIAQLLNAVNFVTQGEVELDRPKSPEPSTNDPAL